MTKHINQASQNQIEKPCKQFKVSVAEQDIIYLESHRTVLECIESADIEVHYHCRDGYCGACRVTLLNGQINYPQGEPLAFVGDNEILPCCCVPVSDIKLKLE
jgi:ferredoxin